MTNSADSDSRAGPKTIGLAVLLAVFLLFTRRPDAFTTPQFWAEDGAIWYADSYNLGPWKALLVPSAGYLQSLPRLCAGMALAFPLALAPAVCNAVAILVQVLPAVFFLSRRFSLIAKLSTRAYLSLLYLALPNSSELHANITCAQWHWAVLVFLVLIAANPPGALWRCFDLSAAGLCALSGPFAIMLAPLAFELWRKTRTKWNLLLTIILSCGASIQGILIAIVGMKARSNEILGMTGARLLKILSGKVFLAAIIGAHDFGSLQSGWNAYSFVAFVVVLAAIGLFSYALLRGPFELRLFIAYGVMLLIAALLFPMASMDTPQWYVLQASRAGLRYWFVPMLAFVATLVWSAAHTRPTFLRKYATIVLVLMTIGIIRDWRYPALLDLQFAQYASSFAKVSPGTRFRIPLNPSGWSMELVKHPVKSR